MLAYGLTIISFMAGVHWGWVLAGGVSRINLLIVSNIVALLGWAFFIWVPAPFVFWGFALLFAALFFVDTQLDLNPLYLRTRKYVTLIVCSSLAVVALI